MKDSKSHPLADVSPAALGQVAGGGWLEAAAQLAINTAIIVVSLGAAVPNPQNVIDAYLE
jgi:hypothetical protein